MKSFTKVLLLFSLMALPFAIYAIYHYFPLPDDAVFLVLLGYLLIYSARIVRFRQTKRNHKRSR